MLLTVKLKLHEGQNGTVHLRGDERSAPISRKHYLVQKSIPAVFTIHHRAQCVYQVVIHAVVFRWLDILRLRHVETGQQRQQNVESIRRKQMNKSHAIRAPNPSVQLALTLPESSMCMCVCWSGWRGTRNLGFYGEGKTQIYTSHNVHPAPPTHFMLDRAQMRAKIASCF